MNPNYMNFFDPAGTGGVPQMGSNFNQSSFSNPAAMTPGNNSFLNMINGAPSVMGLTPGQPPSARLNPYPGMYGQSGFSGIETSAARLQQFARLAPRGANLYGIGPQGMQDHMMAFDMQQMARVRLKQFPDYPVQPRYGAMNQWPRMPGVMPQLQQQQHQQNLIRTQLTMMGEQAINAEQMRMSNMQPNTQPPGTPFRKMPVLEEAPPALRGQSPFVQQQQQPQSGHSPQQGIQQQQQQPLTQNSEFNSNFMQNLLQGNNQSDDNSILNLSLNLPSAEGLNLPKMNFPSPQRQTTQTSFPNFLSNFNNDLASISTSVPQSPKLTHFGPSPASSVASFDQQTATTTSNNTQSTSSSAASVTELSSSPTSVTNSSVSLTIDSASSLLSTNSELKPKQEMKQSPIQSKYQPHLNQMPQIPQEINKLKELPNMPQHANQLQTLNQQYQQGSRQNESVNKKEESVNIPKQNNVQIPNSQNSITNEISKDLGQKPLLEDSLLNDGLNIPELDGFDSKDSFLSDSKTDNLFSAAVLGSSSDVFPGASIFGGDRLGDITLDALKKEKAGKELTEAQKDLFFPNLVKQKQQNTENELKSQTSSNMKIEASKPETSDIKSITLAPTSTTQTFQTLQPLRAFTQNNIQSKQTLPPQQPLPLQLPTQQQPPQQHPQQQQNQFLTFPFMAQFNPQLHPAAMPFQPMAGMAFPDNATVSGSMPNPITSIQNQMLNFGNMYQLPQQQQQNQVNEGKGRGGKGRGKGGKGAGRGGKSGKGRAGRPPGSLNKNKKKKEKEPKKTSKENISDDDELDDPTEVIKDRPFDESLLDPAMKRSLRERTKKKNYKEDFDYNLSEEDEKKKENQDDKDSENKTLEPVISGGANEFVAYRPNLEKEGEIAIIEKILAMRTRQDEGGESENGDGELVEEYFVKYKAYSYLHCEWGTCDYLTKKDKRAPGKIKRFQQKRDTQYALLNELDDEPFNPDYLEIDRVLATQDTTDPVTSDTFRYYLVKWRALPYEESTWELETSIDESIIKQYEELKKPPPLHLRTIKMRPQEFEWKKFERSPLYKNGNKLHEYQLEGLNWLTFCWYRRTNCILADEMGLGKTIQSISLLCAMKQYGIRGPFLVIAPLSTIANWQREFETWTDINAIVYHGSAQSRLHIQQYEMYYKDEKGDTIPSIYKFEAIITTYEMVISANSFLCTIPFRCLIIDEAHRLKNQKCKLIEGLNNLQMEFRVLLTGTPLQNNVEELFSLLNFLDPARFPSQEAFLLEFGNLKTEGQVEKLQQILKPMMLRRLKEDVDQNIATKEETIVEVELTTIQKKFYRAILEKNFSFLVKGSGYSNLPNLMNTMMELRKCCNHPFLIKGAEDKIVSEYLTNSDDPQKAAKQLKALIESSGKMVLIDKLLPKLKSGGHKVLIFSQMIRVLNLIEDYLISKQYLFERIDGGVQGNMRQAAIDRFCRPDSDRFIFLLCTRAGGLGINLTAADTVIIFDSDWNPQNDLQAQARCHRIGQNKPVKVYRLICRNTYEREMFDRASLKLGLDKAVLQNMNAKEGPGGSQQTMSKKEVEDLLKKGAYGAVMEADDDSQNFCEEDIDQILERRTQIIQIQSEGKGSTFAKASFVSDKARQDIDLDDPDFWKKWAKKASVDLDQLDQENQLIVEEPRKRKQVKRFGGDLDASVEMSDSNSDDETYEPYRSNKSKHVGFIERSAWTRVECFKVAKNLLIYGWGRWQLITSHARLNQEVKFSDIEAITRTILAYCFRHYKTDERNKQFFIDLIDESVKRTPKKKEKTDINQILSGASPKSARGRKRGGGGKNALRKLTHQYSKPALIECGEDWQTIDPDQLIIDSGYRKHLQHHCNKIMTRVRLLHCLQHDIIKEAAPLILEGKSVNDIELSVPVVDGELPAQWWDTDADKSLIIGTFKHGYEKYRSMRNDVSLCYYHKLGPLVFNEKVQGSPDSMQNPASVEPNEDTVSDAELPIPNKVKKLREKNEEEDSLNETDEEKEVFSNTASPASANTSTTKEGGATPDISKHANPDKRWPLPADMNTRLRRLITAFLKTSEKEYLDFVRAEKDKQKQERLAIIAQEKQRRKAELQQKWTRREEADFYRVVSNFGVIFDAANKKYDWDKFRLQAKLEKKHDDRLTTYFEEFMAMCRKVCGKETEEDRRRFGDKEMTVEVVSEDRASKCLQRIRLLSKIREQVLVHEKLEERVDLCQVATDFPWWWESGKHDLALLQGVANHGLYRTEYNILLEPDSIFREVIEKTAVQAGKIPPPSEKRPEASQSSKPGTPTASLLNGEHPAESGTTGSLPKNEDGNSRPPMSSAEYGPALSTWPKDKAIVSHLEKVCTCVLKGEWPVRTRFDIANIPSRMPVISRCVSNNIPYTKPEPVIKDEGRGDEIPNNRDFKIKSIDGLKLTVKSESKKKKRRPDGIDSPGSEYGSPYVYRENQDKSIEPQDHLFMKDERLEGVLMKKKKSDIEGETPNIENSSGVPRNVTIHIPKSVSSTVSSTSHSTSKPIIHFPSNVKVSTASVSQTSHEYSTISESEAHEGNYKEHEATIVKREGLDHKVIKASSSHDQPIGIPIDSPNANVRIQGSKIEIKEKPSIKREINLSEVILKIPDPTQFHKVKDKKKSRPVKPNTVKPVYDSEGKVVKNAVVSNPCEHKKEPYLHGGQTEKYQSETIRPQRSRPERSAKKRAKDSITEMSNEDSLSLHERFASSPPPHIKSSEIPSPTSKMSVAAREYYQYEYSQRPISPTINHRIRSPVRHGPPSPEHYHYRAMMHSPPLHGRPYSPPPRYRRRSRSPPLHALPPSLGEIEDSKHRRYSEPVSPHYSHRDEHFRFSPRSKSPYYLDYRNEGGIYEEERERSFNRSRLFALEEGLSPPHRQEKYPYLHNESHSPRKHDIRSPVPSHDSRFPYGHILDWESPRYNKGEGKRDISSHEVGRSISSYQYQPLSKMSPERELKKIKHSGIDREPPNKKRYALPDEKLHLTSKTEKRSMITEPPRLAAPNKKAIKRSHDAGPPRLYSPPKKAQQPLSFYPIDSAKQKQEHIKPKPVKPAPVARPVIEIPEQPVRTPTERKTPTSTKKKGIGSLLEMKIQGLKKQRMEQMHDVDKDSINSSPRNVINELKDKASKCLSPTLSDTAAIEKKKEKRKGSILDGIAKNLGTSKQAEQRKQNELGIKKNKAVSPPSIRTSPTIRTNRELSNTPFKPLKEGNSSKKLESVLQRLASPTQKTSDNVSKMERKLVEKTPSLTSASKNNTLVIDTIDKNRETKIQVAQPRENSKKSSEKTKRKLETNETELRTNEKSEVAVKQS